jgi:hypothetical protein
MQGFQHKNPWKKEVVEGKMKKRKFEEVAVCENG